MEFYIAQVISVLTTIVAIVMMQFKKMHWILLGQITANLLSGSTYLLLGGLSGAGISVVAVVQSVVMFLYNRRGRKPHLPVVIGFIVLYIACSVYYYTSPIDLCSSVAAVTFAVSIMQENAAASRRWYVFNPLFWLIYDAYTGAYVNILVHGAVLVSTVMAMVRLDGLFRKKA